MWIVECLDYVLKGFVYRIWIDYIHLAGECPEVFVFIHREMSQRTMLAEDARGEGPKHRVKQWNVV